MVSKRLLAGEDPFPITYCQRKTSREYEHEKTAGVQSAMIDLLQQILESTKLSNKEKRKKLVKFREAYPDLYKARFPTEQSQPEFMLNKSAKMSSSLSKLKSVIRL